MAESCEHCSQLGVHHGASKATIQAPRSMTLTCIGYAQGLFMRYTKKTYVRT
jgi:hypothetical protein